MPRIKVRFILESSNKNRYLGVNMPSSVSPSLGTAAKRRSKIFLTVLLPLRVCRQNPFGFALCKLCGLRRQTRIARIGR